MVTSSGERVEMSGEKSLQEMYFIMNGFNVLVCSIRVIMYLKFNTHLSQLTDTFLSMTGTLCQFLLIWYMNLVSFILMGHLIFGDKIVAWSTFVSAMNEAIGITLGITDFFSMMDADPIGVSLEFRFSTSPSFSYAQYRMLTYADVC
jgi:hypothetical protein